jgi:hypothetical protein
VAISKVVIECPFCSEKFKAESPDKLHSAYSIEKPIASGYHGDVVKSTRAKHICQSPECTKLITIYWYAPTSCFDRGEQSSFLKLSLGGEKFSRGSSARKEYRK